MSVSSSSELISCLFSVMSITIQDKVVEFAKLDCYQMLEETEKAVSFFNQRVLDIMALLISL